MRTLLVIFAAVALAVRLMGTDWYVDADATGAGNGTSRADAWTSFAGISTNPAAGDVVWVYRPDSGANYARWTVAESGTDANTRITIKGVDEGSGKPYIVGINGANFDYIAVIGMGFTQPDTSTAYTCIALTSGSTGWLIQDNDFITTYFGAVALGGGSFHIVRHNYFEDIGATSLGFGGGSVPVTINVNGTSNLVEYNRIVSGFDRTRIFGTGNVVRNNSWNIALTEPWTGTATEPSPNQYPHHTDSMQSFGPTPIVKALFDRNFDTDNGDEFGASNCHGILVQDNTGGLGLEWVITRFNVQARVGGTAWSVKEVNNTFTYNETWVAINHWATSSARRAMIFEPGDADSDVADVRNITLTDSPNCLESTGFIDTVADVTNITWGTLHTFNYTGSQPAYPATAGVPANLTKADPVFTDPNNDNYTLDTGSPLIAAGSSTIVASGNGTNSTSLTVGSVAQAKRIFDGWGIADADFIKIGSGDYVQVSSIDYDTGVVTLTEQRSWSNGDTVWVMGMEDVGAYPKTAGTSTQGTTIASGSISGTTATVTVTSAFNTRFVEILADGIPVGSDYSEVGNVYTITGLPAATVYIARAYSEWAAADPTDELQIYTTQETTPATQRRNPAALGIGSNY